MRKNSKSAWTQDDEKYLIDNYKQTPYAELAEKLGRSKQAITARISLLGLDTKRNLIGMYHDRIIKLARELIAKRLGHTDTLMIRRVYGHLLKETEDKGNRMIVGFL